MSRTKVTLAPKPAPAQEVSANEVFSAEAVADLSDRLKRIEGQVRGVQRMVEEGRNCRDILNQLNAVRAAAYQVSLLLVRDYATQCLRESDESGTIDDLVKTLSQLPY
ncbi:MAG: metal-sensitive transcriptional regulator [Chloroflexi bacterium]|nr:metal-sensitive transcriptional regulator [Chloroflexota bacterium]MBI3733789.1 metal-sensitive transcriptional regulator [Chloroflexota bacterium]